MGFEVLLTHPVPWLLRAGTSCGARELIHQLVLHSIAGDFDIGAKA